MKILNALPYDRCESCKQCLLSVQDTQNVDGEKVLIVRCKKVRKCQEGGNADADGK